MKRSSALKIATITIAIAIFFISLQYILATFRWMNIAPILKHAKLIYLIGGGAISIIIFWIFRTLRWFILLNHLNIKINFIDLYLYSAVSIGFSIITPFQSGEALKVELLKICSTIERISGYSTFAVERVIDFFIIASMATVSILGISNIGINKPILIYSWVVLVLLLAVSILAIKKFQIPGRIGRFIDNAALCIGNIQTFILIIILTICSWIMVIIGWQICLYSISLDIGFQKTMSLTSTVCIVNVLSFIPGALGISEASIAEILIRFGYSSASAQAGALVIRLYGIMILFLSGIHIIVWKISKAWIGYNDSKS